MEKIMDLSVLQKWVANDWKQRSAHHPTVEQQLLYIIEEFGEVAEAIRKQAGKKDRVNKKVDLGSEMADLIISITTLANHFEIDLSRELEAFQERISQRHQAGF